MTDSNLIVQRLTNSLLQVFIELCDHHELNYYVSGGSLIGVLRHKGFIPWDDDIDIVMPRTDYDRFIQIMRSHSCEGYGICNRYTNGNWFFAMSQFIDLESEILIDLAKQRRKGNIWIDIFPIDGLPSNRIHRWLRVKHIMFIRYLIQLTHIETQVDYHRKRSLFERVVLGVSKKIPFKKLLNTEKMLDYLEKVLRKSDYNFSDYAGNLLGRYREKEVVPKEYFGNPIKGEFEGRMVNIPEYSHELLTTLYGDYMKLPPVNERSTHHVTLLKSRTS